MDLNQWIHVVFMNASNFFKQSIFSSELCLILQFHTFFCSYSICLFCLNEEFNKSAEKSISLWFYYEIKLFDNFSVIKYFHKNWEIYEPITIKKCCSQSTRQFFSHQRIFDHFTQFRLGEICVWHWSIHHMKHWNSFSMYER